MSRHISFTILICLALIVALFANVVVVPARPAAAATIIERVAQLPAGNPIYTQSVRVWINSDTAASETAGLGYRRGGSTGTYVEILGTPDTSYPGANWRVDIPPQPVGTLVEYRLFVRNPSGPDDPTTNFAWAYRTQDLPSTVWVDDSWIGSPSGSDLGQPGVLNFGGNAFATIQGGVNGVTATGEVNVYTGVYTENIIITKPIMLAGWDAADTIVIYPAVSNPNCGGAGGAVLCAGASNLILVQANNVTIHDLTLDGDNPNLNGANIDARNGIIENYSAGIYNNLTVYNTTIRNIYLRGLSASSGGDDFYFHDNTAQNVQGSITQSVAIGGDGGIGVIADNTIDGAADAIALNYSRGAIVQRNTVTNSSSGVRSENNGSLGGTYDVLEWNNVSACTANGSGVRVFAPYRDVSVHDNTITGCAIGLAAAGQGAAATPSFAFNAVDGQLLSNSVGVSVTTRVPGSGSSNVSATFDFNTINNTQTGIYLEQETGRQLASVFTNHTLTDNTSGLSMTGGSVTFAGNNVSNGTTALTQSGGALLAYANNFINYTTPVNRSAGAANLAHNWWGAYSAQPSGLSTADWKTRLGAKIVALSSLVWAEGDGAVSLGDASLSGSIGTAVIVVHGHSYEDAPFGNVTLDSMCSNYYDFFTVNGGGTYTVSVPVDDTPECNAQTLDPGKIYWIPTGTDYAADCIDPNNTNTACWDLITTNVITGSQNITVTGLTPTQLGGTQFVAGSTTGTDPTAVAIVAFTATTDRASAPAGIILVSALVAVGIVLIVRRRR